MGVKDIIKKMEELAAPTQAGSTSDAAPADKAATSLTQPAAVQPADAAPLQDNQPDTQQMEQHASSAPPLNGPAKENGAQLPPAAQSAKEPEDPEKKAKKVQCCVSDVFVRAQYLQ